MANERTLTNEEVASINTERLGNWGRFLTDQNATAIVTIGVSHHGTRLILCTNETDEHFTNEVLQEYLVAAARSLGKHPDTNN